MSRPLLSLVGSVLCCLCLSVAGAPSAPNVILFLADDVGYGDIGAFGAPVIQTPHIDRMAAEGMRFTQWYSAAPLCTPSRGALLTGRLPIRIGLYTKYPYPMDLVYRVFFPSSVGSLPQSEATIGDLLRPAGYASALIGKWHLGHVDALPTMRGFDTFYGIPYAHDEGYPGSSPADTVFPPVPLYRGTELIEQPVDLSTLTPRLVNEAIRVIDNATANGQPFFLLFSFPQAHIPSFSSLSWRGVSRAGAYGDMVEEMDDAIGAILEHVRLIGQDERTLSIFTSDNGAWPFAVEPLAEQESVQPDGGSNGPFREGKGSTWEGGVREPTVVRWPGVVPAGETSLALATHMDIAPTLLDLAGLEPALGLDGKSLVPLITGANATGPHDFIFFWREHTLMAVRHLAWKAHFVTRSGFEDDPPKRHDPPLIFNVEKDPGERFVLSEHDIPYGILDAIILAANRHKESIVHVPSQYDTNGTVLPGNDFTVVPCCRPVAVRRPRTNELYSQLIVARPHVRARAHAVPVVSLLLQRNAREAAAAIRSTDKSPQVGRADHARDAARGRILISLYHFARCNFFASVFPLCIVRHYSLPTSTPQCMFHQFLAGK